MDDMLRTNRNLNRINVFYSVEASVHEPLVDRNISKDFFNISITMRRDSTIWQPYDKFVKFEKKDKENENVVWTEKSVSFWKLFTYLYF